MEKSRIAGILSIVSGGLGIFGSIIWVIMILVMYFTINTSITGMPSYPNTPPAADRMFDIVIMIYAVFSIGLFLVSLLAVIGGIFTLKRKYWGLALTGSIAAILAFMPCGIASLIFVITGKEEFRSVGENINAMVEE